MYEWLVGVGGIVAFIAQYIYILGKLSARMQGCEENITWIRNFLLVRFVNPSLFSQMSPIKLKGDIKEYLPPSWRDVLDSLTSQLRDSKDPFDYAVQLSDNQGLIRLKERADDANLDLNDFLLLSAVYLHEKSKYHKT